MVSPSCSTKGVAGAAPGRGSTNGFLGSGSGRSTSLKLAISCRTPSSYTSKSDCFKSRTKLLCLSVIRTGNSTRLTPVRNVGWAWPAADCGGCDCRADTVSKDNAKKLDAAMTVARWTMVNLVYRTGTARNSPIIAAFDGRRAPKFALRLNVIQDY